MALLSEYKAVVFVEVDVDIARMVVGQAAAVAGHEVGAHLRQQAFLIAQQYLELGQGQVELSGLLQVHKGYTFHTGKIEPRFGSCKRFKTFA